MTTSAKILITGFRPFLGEKINPSEILLDQLKRDFAFQGNVDTLLLPVSFVQAPQILQEHLAKKKYDVILLLGQAGGRAKICLERVALNWIETENPDEEGYQPSQGPIVMGQAPAIFCELPLEMWKQQLQKKNLPVTISLSAGGYVCNYVYYQVLLKLQEQKSSCRACFIHVPYLPEQTLNKENMPSLTLEIMKSTLAEILTLI